MAFVRLTLNSFGMTVQLAPFERWLHSHLMSAEPLDARIQALNNMANAGYPAGLLIAPVILLPDWERLYSELIEQLADERSETVKKIGFIEIILMIYSFV